jgi:hypothetical protein
VTTYNFDAAFTFWIGAAIVATLIPLSLWKTETNKGN